MPIPVPNHRNRVLHDDWTCSKRRIGLSLHKHSASSVPAMWTRASDGKRRFHERSRCKNTIRIRGHVSEDGGTTEPVRSAPRENRGWQGAVLAESYRILRRLG